MERKLVSPVNQHPDQIRRIRNYHILHTLIGWPNVQEPTVVFGPEKVRHSRRTEAQLGDGVAPIRIQIDVVQVDEDVLWQQLGIAQLQQNDDLVLTDVVHSPGGEVDHSLVDAAA